jgi:glycosyltransferase involved in cell wall biosynthesis
MKILLAEPFLTGSHNAWSREYSERSAHEIFLIGLEGRHWKWRMHGGAVTVARRFLESPFDPDLVLASDMLDLTTFLALTGERTAGVKTAIYFHENQITYPWSESDSDPSLERDAHYGFINFSSALAADAVFFNSRYHMDSFLAALGPFLEGFPDHKELDSIHAIEAKSRVLPLGVDLGRFDGFHAATDPSQPPLILWNHRWEYDKNPDEFFRALFELRGEGLEFEIVLLGERFSEAPAIFDEAKRHLRDAIIHSGYVEDFAQYARWLHRADILPVTSIHDFFGRSIVEAIYCNCYPLLPKRLAYPEHIPVERHGEFFYDDFDDLLSRLRDLIENIDETRNAVVSGFVEKYDWGSMITKYDRVFENIKKKS